MINSKSIKLIALVGIGVLGANSANAATYHFSGTVTVCTTTCNGFASLDVGTEISGTWEIITTAGGSWSFADMGGFAASIFNPGAPVTPFDGTNSTTANPLPLVDAIAPIVAAGGGLTTGGTTDTANELNSGNILHEFIEPPFSESGAWVIFDIGAGGVAQAQVCLFFLNVGCVPGATQTAVIDGQFTLVPIPAAAWLFGSALLGFLGLRRRA